MARLLSRETVTEATDAVRMFGRSSRSLVRDARARYTTELLKWPHRDAFDSLWGSVQWIPGWFHEGSAALLYQIMRADPPQTVVEIGSYLGRSTVFFGLTLREVNPDGVVVAIDPHTGDRQQLEGLSTDRLATYDLFCQHCRAAGVEAFVEAHLAESLEVARDWARPVDLLYVDGWHSYAAVIADGEAWLPHLTPGGVVVFDDYVAYDEVRQAVHDLAERGRCRLWGTIFGQAIAGTAAEPPAAVRRALLLSGSGLRRRVSPGSALRR
jgi:predicted O-methyltransferase YrrM